MPDPGPRRLEWDAPAPADLFDRLEAALDAHQEGDE